MDGFGAWRYSEGLGGWEGGVISGVRNLNEHLLMMVTMMKMMVMMMEMMACSILSSHANHVNPNQCSSSGTHKSFGNREICNRRKREICIFKTEKYALKKSKVQRRQACVLSQSSSDNQKQFR